MHACVADICVDACDKFKNMGLLVNLRNVCFCLAVQLEQLERMFLFHTQRCPSQFPSNNIVCPETAYIQP